MISRSFSDSLLGASRDPKLANGFNAFGLSQGNNLIRGYIQKYNDPPCHTFMSICGINAVSLQQLHTQSEIHGR